MTNPAEQARHPRQPVTVAIDLNEPIEREGGTVGRLLLRQPRAGELRGLSVKDLATSDAAAVIALLPRICDPYITEAEAADLCMQDFAEVAGTIVGFFMSPAQKALVEQMTGASPPKT